VKRWKRDAKFFNLCRKMRLLVEMLLETVLMVPNEHTGVLRRQVSRIYRITKK
jgi:hypothetical protein